MKVYIVTVATSERNLTILSEIGINIHHKSKFFSKWTTQHNFLHCVEGAMDKNAHSIIVFNSKYVSVCQQENGL